jgi:hypothetical protein
MRRHRQPHKTICQPNVREDTFWFVMEVKEIPIVELNTVGRGSRSAG